MRNASDIFCLNEDITDGNDMFSVNGSCPMRLRRRPIPQQSDCFEYGRSNIDKYEGGDAEMERNGLELSDGAPDQDIDKYDSPRSVQNSTRPPSEYSAVAEDNNPETPKSMQQNRAPSEFSVVTNRSDRRSGGNKMKNVQKVEGNNEPDNISISNMSRNPLTGAGMEIKQHRKPKKGHGSNNDKWVW